jgi:chromosome segregation ATPase
MPDGWEQNAQPTDTLLLALSMGMKVGPAVAQQAAAEIARLRAEVERLAGELARVTAMLSDVSAQRETYRADLIIARKRISELERENEQLATAYRNL